MSRTVHFARLAGARSVATDTYEYDFRLEPEDEHLTWRGGQFISLNVGHKDDDTPILRSYSLASRGGGGGFKIVMKLVPGGPASAWFRALPVGERVRFTGPMGFFVLDLAHAGDVVFAATGTGLAPFIPMIEELLERPAETERGRVHLFFGVRDETDLFYTDELARLVDRAAGRLRVITALTRPPETWSGARGRINDHVYALLPGLAHPTFYLCGNGAMIREVKTALVERGVDRKRQIRTEAFYD